MAKQKSKAVQAVEEAVDELKQDIPQIVEDAGKEAIEEIKENVSVSLPVEPVVEFHPKADETSQTVESIPSPVAYPDPTKILVDKKLFYKMAYALGTSKTFAYTGFAAIRAIGQMLGAKTHQEELKKWEEIKSEQ